MTTTTLVLMGRTGNGKSATGNSIIGDRYFPSLRSFKSVTKECAVKERTWEDGRKIRVVDTPGLFDTSASKEFIDKEIVKCIDHAKDGIHAILFVISFNNRFSEEEAKVCDKLHTLFGASIANYMVLVVTGGDTLEEEHGTLQNYLDNSPRHLKMLLRRCNGRAVLFDNKTTSEKKKKSQITGLLKHVDNIIAENENEPYSNELFQNTKEMTSSLFFIRDKEKEYQEQVKKLNEMIEKNVRAAEEKVQKITEELEEQLTSVDNDKKKAENAARLLQKKLQDANNAIESFKKAKPGQYCSIL